MDGKLKTRTKTSFQTANDQTEDLTKEEETHGNENQINKQERFSAKVLQKFQNLFNPTQTQTLRQNNT